MEHQHLEFTPISIIAKDIKGIFSDSNSVCLKHESEDVNKKKIISKSSIDSNLHSQVMNNHVH